MADGTQWWAVMVGDADGNSGTERLVGPFRSEYAAHLTRQRIEKRLRAGGVDPLADVVPMERWEDVLDA